MIRTTLRFALPLAFAAALSGCGGAHMQPRPLRPHADPGGVVATEIAFARMAADKGQWSAFRAFADPAGAEMFVPARVSAAVWLKGRADPKPAVQWQPHLAWSSCDGTIAVTHGAWQRGGESGYFTTVWAWQPRDGSYKWVLDHGDRLESPLPAPEMIGAHTAECSGHPGVPLSAPPVGADMKQIVARDQTLQVSSTVHADGSRRVTVRAWTGKDFATVIDDQVEAGPAEAKR